MKIYNKTFYGAKISDYGLEHSRVDYGALRCAFDCVLCNDITRLFFSEINGEYIEPELINGADYNDDGGAVDIFQYYIISQNGAEILQRLTDEIVYYIEPIDLYIWGATHYGTSWDYVLTDIEIDNED
jgi:hypothetical protein